MLVAIYAAARPTGFKEALWPSYTGAHSWMPMAFSPKTGLVYIPKLEQGAKYTDEKTDLKAWKPKPGTVGDAASR